MSLRINDIAPNFTALTARGIIDFHPWIGDGRKAPRPCLRLVRQPH